MKSFLNKYSLDVYMAIITGYVISIIAALLFDYLKLSGSVPFYIFCIIVIIHLLVLLLVLVGLVLGFIESRRTFVWTIIFIISTLLLAAGIIVKFVTD